MPQHAPRQVALATVGVDQRAVFGQGDGVDGEVAAQQVFFQRHARCGVDGKAAVARCGLAFGARQRHFFAGVRIQEDGEVLADGFVAEGQQCFGCGAHGHPVAVAGRQPQQLVAHCTAHHKQLHRLQRWLR